MVNKALDERNSNGHTKLVGLVVVPEESEEGELLDVDAAGEEAPRHVRVGQTADRVGEDNLKETFNVERGLLDFSWSYHTKMGKIYQIAANLPNGHENMPNGNKINNILHSKALQNMPKFGFLV
jgi:hypothetical protein